MGKREEEIQFHEKKQEHTPLKEDIEESLKQLKEYFHHSGDMVFHRFDGQGILCALVYVDGLSNRDMLNRDVVTPLVEHRDGKSVPQALGVAEFKTVKTVEELSKEVLMANAVLLVQDSPVGYAIEAKGFERRSVSEPNAEEVVRGPREAFVENIRANTSLLRRKIRSSQLVFENVSIGRQTNTPVVIAYLANVVNQDVLSGVRRQIQKIDIDGIFDSGYIEQLTEKSPLSPFSKFFNSQKPDVVASKLLEGRVAVICDGSPHVITAPHLFIENLQVSEDYYSRTLLSCILRVVRVVSLFVSVLLPGIYVALVTFSPEAIPTVLLMQMISQRASVPLSAGLEAFLMLFVFELIKESGLRLPKPVGSAISIVGGLIVGQAAVEAGLVALPMVIVIAITAVTAFTIPSLNEAVTVYRFLFLALGYFMGFVGILCGALVVFFYMAGLDSFGVGFLSYYGGQKIGQRKDGLLRMPLYQMLLRPRNIVKRNLVRQKKREDD